MKLFLFFCAIIYKLQVILFSIVMLGIAHLLYGISPMHCVNDNLINFRPAIRYTTPRGIGYSEGYTTLEGFILPSCCNTVVPFVDIRAHLFDNGKFASNTGIGCRYLVQNRVLGINTYYDYRNYLNKSYHSASIGMESLGEIYDLRINAYIPFGKGPSNFYNSMFNSFNQNNLIIDSSKNFILGGLSGEAEIHFDAISNLPLHFALGPYYLSGKYASTWGGEMRGGIELFSKYCRLEGKVSYDHYFKWIGQVEIGVKIPIGSGCAPCGLKSVCLNRLVQPVVKHEIIPVGKYVSQSIAINPETNAPWVFWFVDNTSSSLGTYENPFSTLLQAQEASSIYEAIYVYPGDGTSTGMNAGIFLKEFQQFLGSSASHIVNTTRGSVEIKALTSTIPKITNFFGNVVDLSSNNVVSGFEINLPNNEQNGLHGENIENLIASNNQFIATGNDSNGIYLLNPLGSISIKNCGFSDFVDALTPLYGNGIFVELLTNHTLDNLSISQCEFSNFTNPHDGLGSCGVAVHLFGGSLNSFTLTKSYFDEFYINGNGVLVQLTAHATLSNCTVDQSYFTNFYNNSPGVFLTTSGGTLSSLKVSNCLFNDVRDNSAGISLYMPGGVLNRLKVSKSRFVSIEDDSAGVSLEMLGGTILYTRIHDCAFNNMINDSSGIAVDLPSGLVSDLRIIDNRFVNVSEANAAAISWSQNSAGHSFVQVLRNDYAGSGTAVDGYAALFEVKDGGLCLDFIYNKADALSNASAYLFEQVNPSVFNVTHYSNSSTNEGEFILQGTIGACSH